MVQIGKLKIGTDKAAVERAKGRAESEKLEALVDLEEQKRWREEEARTGSIVAELKARKFTDDDNENIEFLTELLSDYFTNGKNARYCNSEDYEYQMTAACKAKLSAFFAVPERQEKFQTQYIQFLKTNAFLSKAPDAFALGAKGSDEWEAATDINSLSKYWNKIVNSEVERQLNTKINISSASGAKVVTGGGTSGTKVVTGGGTSSYNRTVVLVIAIITGWIGGHRYYVGKTKTGVLYTFTVGLWFIGWIIDIIQIVTDKFTDARGDYIKAKKES